MLPVAPGDHHESISGVSGAHLPHGRPRRRISPWPFSFLGYLLRRSRLPSRNSPVPRRAIFHRRLLRRLRARLPRLRRLLFQRPNRIPPPAPLSIHRQDRRRLPRLRHRLPQASESRWSRLSGQHAVAAHRSSRVEGKRQVGTGAYGDAGSHTLPATGPSGSAAQAAML